ncbi:hypothetical protein [Deinococcus pimensis]|uniref:hypothetical protein n=1 Tax=Deinococcus pimensis TaxID=309888 RepID=UPI0004891BAD|nr:hypothetical protein [Deinococcus pimensis]
MLILTSRAVIPRVVHDGSAARHITELQCALEDGDTTLARDLLDTVAQTLAGRPARAPEIEHVLRHPHHLGYLLRSYQAEFLTTFEQALLRPA